jgi:EAL domain-containing protein (putative c-di-GMP-specific phosphodiesterase class I)
VIPKVYAALLLRERLAAVERDQERLELERTETETVISQEKRSKTTLRHMHNLHYHFSY